MVTEIITAVGVLHLELLALTRPQSSLIVDY